MDFIERLLEKTRFYKLVNYFHETRNKAKLHSFLYIWVEALHRIEKEESFDVKAISMFLPRGYVAMDKNNRWTWHKRKPKIQDDWFWSSNGRWWDLGMFNLERAKDWKKSVRKVGIKS